MLSNLKGRTQKTDEPISVELLGHLLRIGRESRVLDFKREFDPSVSGAWQELVKDIVAMANMGGGHIIIGATNNGKPSNADLSAMQALDQAHYIDQIQRYVTTECGDIEVACFKHKNCDYGFIKIGPVSPPLVFNKDGNYKSADGRQKSAFVKGAIYTRHGSKSEPANQADLHKWFHKYHKKERTELLKHIHKAVTLPKGFKLEQVPQEFRIVHDQSAQAFRPSSDPNAPVLPFRFPPQNGKYENINEEFIGAVRAWKTDPTAYIPESQLWKFYQHRENLETTEEYLTCLLVSSMYRHCPVFYWASQMKKDSLIEVLKEQAEADKHPAVNVVAHLAFALGDTDGREILEKLEGNTHYRFTKYLSTKLRQSLKTGKTIWQYHGFSAINKMMKGRKNYNDIFSIKKDKKVLEKRLTELTINKSTRAPTKQVDSLLYGTELRNKTNAKGI